MSTAEPLEHKRHPNLYAHAMWRQQRFFAGFLVAVGLVMTGIVIYQHQLTRASSAVWLLYIPSGLLLGGAFLVYRSRSHVHVQDAGLKISTLLSSVVLDYDAIKSVRSQTLRTHFLDRRSRMVAPIMKAHIDKPALFIRVRGDETELAAIKKKLGARLMHEDTIAIPVPDPDAAVWEITEHLPERLGQNQGGSRRRKRRR
ncbi:MAG TPA: hypothetical protein VGG90_12230 [Candidatus Dormibacteraeota bacterium]